MYKVKLKTEYHPTSHFRLLTYDQTQLQDGDSATRDPFLSAGRDLRLWFSPMPEKSVDDCVAGNMNGVGRHTFGKQVFSRLFSRGKVEIGNSARYLAVYFFRKGSEFVMCPQAASTMAYRDTGIKGGKCRCHCGCGVAMDENHIRFSLCKDALRPRSTLAVYFIEVLFGFHDIEIVFRAECEISRTWSSISRCWAVTQTICERLPDAVQFLNHGGPFWWLRAGTENWKD